ncbi:MAG TPA: tryptophan 2,3-dioxygenase family protein, partial [Micropepsaceae bacterium]|nr:tryptophan 2,3-dioxygenase family protein [Micropepsaceae bacterium]
MDYASYLQLSRILSAQAPESARRGTPAHDEMLFIIIHQSYELWFKQIIHEIGLIDGIFGEDSVDEADLGRAVHAAERIVRIQRHLVAQIDILETMTPMDFLEFRNMLVPASGFQSEQFRIIADTNLDISDGGSNLYFATMLRNGSASVSSYFIWPRPITFVPIVLNQPDILALTMPLHPQPPSPNAVFVDPGPSTALLQQALNHVIDFK